MQIASQITPGRNIANTREALGGETAWDNSMASSGLMELGKDSGSDPVRIPISGSSTPPHKTTKISADWLNRVKQAVHHLLG